MSKVTVSELGPVETEEFKKLMKETTGLKVQQQSIQDNIGDIAERAKEELGIDKAEFNRYAKYAYESHKAREAVEKANEEYENCIKLGFIRGDEDE